MFRKLLQMMGRSMLEPAVLQGTAREYLGDTYAADLRQLQDNHHSDPGSLKRAQGVMVLTRAIHSTRSVLNDPDRHHHFWTEVARPSIDARYQESFGQGYDPSRWYVDALDYAAVMNILPSMLASGEQSVAVRVIDTVKALNLRELATGGYFGNTPYWVLHDHPLWRSIDRDFNSVQAYWLALLAADEASATLQSDLAQAILAVGLDEVAAWNAGQSHQVFAVDLPQLAQLVALGALAFAAAKHLDTTRGRALHTIMEAFSRDASYFFVTMMQAQMTTAIAQLKVAFADDHPLQGLPDHQFLLGMKIQAALIKVLANVDLTETLIHMSKTEAVINDPRNQVPHLLQASL